MSRKSELKALFAGGVAPSAEKTPETKSAVPAASPPRAASGAVKAMGLALGDMAEKAGEAERLKAEVAALREGGTQLVDLDPRLIDPSPFADRLSSGPEHDPSFDALVASIRDSGQQVPVLVRPAPAGQNGEQGGGQGTQRYQAAYGHRRIRAARALGIAVKAVIRPLDDAALMLAQGKENAERRDLSFIERALFAQTLAQAGFERMQMQAALGIHASELTRLLQVAQAVPERIVRAIGPAPKAGRPRWMALGGFLAREANQVKAEAEIAAQRFREADSDARFKLLFDRLSPRSAPSLPAAARPLFGGDGRALGIYRGGAEPAITFAPAEAGFAEWLAENLGEIRKQFIKDGWA